MDTDFVTKTDIAVRGVLSRAVGELINLILSAFMFMSALAWNDAIKIYLDNHEEYQRNGPFFYALVVSMFAIAFTLFVGGFKKPI